MWAGKQSPFSRVIYSSEIGWLLNYSRGGLYKGLSCFNQILFALLILENTDMLSTTVILTAVISAIGFLLNSGMLYLVVSKGKRAYHYLFAAVLLICAIWDVGILLSMLRNNNEKELIIYGYVVFIPCTFLAPLIYQFTTTYLNRAKKRVTVILWIFSLIGCLAIVTGLGGKIVGVFHYSWGNIYQPDKRLQISTLISLPVSWFAMIYSSWILFQASKRESSVIKRRHLIYMSLSFAALTLANIKLAVLYNVDCPFLLPAGMFVNDIFSAVIAIAIIKHHLFDIPSSSRKALFILPWRVSSSSYTAFRSTFLSPTWAMY